MPPGYCARPAQAPGVCSYLAHQHSTQNHVGKQNRNNFSTDPWVVAVTAANSEVATVGTTFVLLKLVIDKGGGQQESVPMGEMLS